MAALLPFPAMAPSKGTQLALSHATMNSSINRIVKSCSSTLSVRRCSNKEDSLTARPCPLQPGLLAAWKELFQAWEGSLQRCHEPAIRVGEQRAEEGLEIESAHLQSRCRFIKNGGKTRRRVHLTTALLTSGRCHLTSTHQLTGQLLLSWAPAKTRALIKPLPRHGPINHVMMSYHSDRWAASTRTKEPSAQRGSDEHVRGTDPTVHGRDCGLLKSGKGETIASDSAALIQGAARLCLQAKHLSSALINNISLLQ